MRISDWSSDVCSSDLEVRHSRAGDQGAFGVLRQLQRLLHPAQGSGFEAGHRRGTDEAEAVLVPGRGKILRGDGGGQRAAGHEAEVAATGTGNGKIGRASSREGVGQYG